MPDNHGWITTNNQKYSDGGLTIVIFLWILLCAGKPDLYDAIMFALTSGKVPL